MKAFHLSRGSSYSPGYDDHCFFPQTSFPVWLIQCRYSIVWRGHSIRAAARSSLQGKNAKSIPAVGAGAILFASFFAIETDPPRTWRKPSHFWIGCRDDDGPYAILETEKGIIPINIMQNHSPRWMHACRCTESLLPEAFIPNVGMKATGKPI